MAAFDDVMHRACGQETISWSEIAFRLWASILPCLRRIEELNVAVTKNAINWIIASRRSMHGRHYTINQPADDQL